MLHALRHRLKLRTALLAVVALVWAISLAVQPTEAAVSFNQRVNFQARLTDANGNIVADGTYNVDFKLYTDSSTGTQAQGTCSSVCVWEETTTVAVSRGLFSTQLGAVTSLAGFDWNRDIYLAIRVGGTGSPNWSEPEMTPRHRLGEAPTAAFAGLADNASNLNGQAASYYLNPTNLATGSGAVTVASGGGLGLTLTSASGTISTASALSSTNTINQQVTSATAFLVQKASAGTIVFTVDTTNSKVVLGTSGTTGEVLVLDSVPAANLPASPTNGSMIYDSTNNKFKCAVSSAWVDCDTTGGGTATLQSAYDASSGNTISTSTSTQRDLAVSLVNNTVGADSNFTVTIGDSATSTVSISRASGSGTVDPSQLLLLDNLDTDRAVAAGLKIQAAAGLITTALDVSDVEIGTALAIGDNDITTTGATISAAELNRLDGKDAALVDVNDTGTIAITGTGALDAGSITANFGAINIGTDPFTTSGTVGTGAINAGGNIDTSGTIQAGSGNENITLATGKLDADAVGLITGDGAGSTSNGSGLETDTDRIGLLQGCSDGQILKWTDASNVWGCAADASGGGGGTLQTDYTASTGGTTPEIKLDSTRTALDIQDADTTIAGNLINVRAANGAGLGTVMFSVGNTGATTIQNSANSANEFTVKNAAGYQLFNVDSSTSANLVGNPGFEVDTSSWALDGSASIARQTSSSYAGVASLAVTVSGANGGAKYTFGSQQSSQQYTLSAYVKASSASTTFLMGYNNGSTDTACLSSQTTFTVGWLRYSCTFTAAVSYVYFRDATSGKNFNLDAIQLETGAVATPYNPGGAVQIRGIINNPIAMRTKEDSNTAFYVSNAAGTGVLTVDTLAGLDTPGVEVGSSTTDANAILLTLDSYNNATDPVNVQNGAMYYNTNLSKFRCREGGAWKDCIAGTTTLRVTADVSNSTTTGADITGLTWNGALNTAYGFQCVLIASSVATTTGIQIGLGGPGSPTNVTAYLSMPSAATSTPVSQTFTAFESYSANTAAVTSRVVGDAKGAIQVGGTAGALSLKFRSEVATSAVTIHRGSFCVVTQ